MEANNLKNTWKSGVDKNITSYSDKELNEIIVKSAKKTMRRIQPTGIFQLVIFAVIALIIFNLSFRSNNIETIILYFLALAILIISYAMSKYSAYKMNKYKADLPIKEWIEYRINEVERTIRFRVKYDIPIYTGAFVLGLGFYILFLIFSKTSLNLFIIIPIAILIIIYMLLVRRSVNKNYNKTLYELKELHKQLEK